MGPVLSRARASLSICCARGLPESPASSAILPMAERRRSEALMPAMSMKCVFLPSQSASSERNTGRSGFTLSMRRIRCAIIPR